MRAIVCKLSKLLHFMMSFQESLKKLKTSKEFKKFKEKNKKSFLFSAFFILDSNLDIETQQLDYFLTNKKVAIFIINDKIKYKTDDFSPSDKITALDENIKVDINELKEIIKKEIEKKSLQAFDINKAIVVLQKIKGKQLWNVTCILSNLKILKMHIDCFNGKVLESKETSVFNFISVKK